MLPILDTPMCRSGWADLFVDPAGRAKLFIAGDKTEAEWQTMRDTLRRLLSDALAQEDYHLLGLTKHTGRLALYLSKKQQVLEEYFTIREWQPL